MPKLIVGNWKMNGLLADSRDLAEKLAAGMKGDPSNDFHMVVCPPATMIAPVAAVLKGSAIRWGGQDCHAEASGAFTGDIAAPMLKDLGCDFVILGHSERRQYHEETSAQVAAKAKQAYAAGLAVIICVGELDAQRSAGEQESVVARQLAESIPAEALPLNTVIAYEPVWAIGTGKTASAEDIRQMHAFIRGKVGRMQILYGGSVKAENAREILHTENVDGVLVGGASLKAEAFMAIAAASRLP
ncbi:MAG: triose-phosphate isomerase [Alphaproteobacteria bacterium]|nr:triose-phosphate isomerase [Alphaproteobacteria bacterium]